jgi:ribosome-associated heat shock protein Hsp15
MDGQRVKVSREIGAGDVLRIRQGWDDREVTVLAVSDQRRGATEARLLYEESAESIARREAEAAARRAAGGITPNPNRRPSKRERRLIHRFKDVSGS